MELSLICVFFGEIFSCRPIHYCGRLHPQNQNECRPSSHFSVPCVSESFVSTARGLEFFAIIFVRIRVSKNCFFTTGGLGYCSLMHSVQSSHISASPSEVILFTRFTGFHSKCSMLYPSKRDAKPMARSHLRFV